MFHLNKGKYLKNYCYATQITIKNSYVYYPDEAGISGNFFNRNFRLVIFAEHGFSKLFGAVHNFPIFVRIYLINNGI